ncbi:hypothetical protein G6F57_008151 [Rhizopus arrhizus]|uniref:Uncharacterized protein n=1 Tax=Rhizopus oryzae TaxID=64495 RepID=A0A9P6X6E3_RHIOR|nr:hypothetical protein G6F24_006274 [Rhizopus arrhizus]KAG1418897.1 hypothetical protein G6F58_004863 [Rhizopus delemar]KAG0939297.1 hypothetical protein G6F30_007329 [Rhizopus arrhizus]KAG0988255.1 hypothetical protein G6F29_001894 [Rhizopus arrhizus]KAG0992820.1 hypothetical protein G6F28_007275 [Rhizopus arrhizus]
MPKSILSRMMGLFSSKPKKQQAKPIQQDQTVEASSFTQIKTIESSRKEHTEIQPMSKEPLFFDTNEEGDEPDMSRFIRIQGDHPQLDEYLNKANQYSKHEEHDEYQTVSSIASSTNISLEEALFSRISSDSMTEITNFSSSSPKIAVRAQLPSNRNSIQSEVEQYQVVDINSPQNNNSSNTASKATTGSNLTAVRPGSERYFCNMYTQALYYLSPQNKGYSPAHAFRLLESIAIEGGEVYQQLDDLTKKIVALSQYRAGRMLYEADYTEEDDAYNHHQQDALMYLLRSQENGNPLAIYTLGVYAEERGKIKEACQFYYAACKAGVLEGKMAFGRIVLRHNVPGFKLEDAIHALTEASDEGYSYASLTLAMYYDQQDQSQNAVKYCNLVDLPPIHPVYHYSNYIMSCIYLKAGHLDLAHIHMAKSVMSMHNDESGVQTKSPVALRKLGIFCLLGIGVSKNPLDAFMYIEEASRLGDRAALIILAYMYTFGVGCQVNREAALKIYERCKENSIAARLSCGLLWMNINQKRAYQEFLSVINFKCELNHEEHWDIQSIKCEAAVRIAVWNFNGIGGAKKDPHGAVFLLQELSNKRNYVGAYYWLAWAYLEGVKGTDGSTILPKDQNKAFHYFLKGATKNHERCLYCVGRMLHEGYSGNSGYQKQDAFQFFLKAANLGCAKAQTQVGISYFHGTAPVAQNLDRAFEYFILAARHNDTEAVIYLADYLFKDYSKSNYINVIQVYSELSRAASNNNPAAYRMLGLVVNKDIDLSSTYVPILRKLGKDNHRELWGIYQESKNESSNKDINSRFALRCLWKALELGDHMSGRYICKQLPKMTEEDIAKTIDIFEKAEGSVPERMSLSLAKFLNVCNKKQLSLKKYLEVAKFNDLNTTSGWESPKCHEEEICVGCDKSVAISLYEKALSYRTNHGQASDNTPDTILEVSIRLKLIKDHYDSYQDSKLKAQLDVLDVLLKKFSNNKQAQEALAETLYYRGLLFLHDYSLPNSRDKAKICLLESSKLGNILARLELGYFYAINEGQEDLAEACFSDVADSKKTSIDFQGRLVETMVSLRPQKMKNPAEDYPKEFLQMKLAAAVTYSLFDMERQAVDWLHEIPDEPLSQILLFYYKMKPPTNRTSQAISRLSDLMAPFETDHSLDYNARMILSYGQFRLGQCFEFGHGTPIDDAAAAEYYNKACAFLKSNEMYEKLAEISQKNGSNNAADLFPTLYNAAHNNKDAMFKLAQYYEFQRTKGSLEKAIAHFRKAADLGHTEACYCYAKYRIKKTAETAIRQEGVASSSKIAADYLRLAANKNHGPAFYELGMLEMKAGMFEEAVDDLKEADFLNCSDASYQLGELYYTGFIGVVQNQVTFKVNQNYEISFDYFMHAYQNDSAHFMAIIKIGSFYEQGIFKKQDLSKAKQWYMMAFSLGKGNGAAEYALGCLEETNIELSGLTPTNELRKTAYEWFVKANALGNKDAKFKVGVYLLNSWLDPHGPDTEKKGLEILIEENNDSELKAMIVLAKYFERKGEYQTAFNYWRNAEMLEDPEALEYIGKCYEEGLLGQKINLEEALYYKQRAIEARKHAKETQCSVMGFQSDYSEERN